MAKINYKVLKKDILSGNLKKLYYFTGEERFFIKNFSNKIFEVCLGEYKNNINFLSFDIEKINIQKLTNAINTFPVNSKKKCILLKGTNFDEMNSDFFDNLFSILNDLPDFCVVIIQDFYEGNNKKSKNYSNFLLKISKISEFCEFKHEIIPCEKQAIIWAKSFGKILSDENSKLLCQKCSYDMQSVKDEIENLRILSRKKEITTQDIEKINVKNKKQNSIFDICKSIKDKNLKLSLEIIDNLILQNEDPMKIFSIICMEFIEAHRVYISLNSGKNSNVLLNIFNYKGKEFKIKNAEYICKIYNIENCIKILIHTDFLLKTTNLSKKNLIDKSIVEILSQ